MAEAGYEEKKKQSLTVDVPDIASCFVCYIQTIGQPLPQNFKSDGMKMLLKTFCLEYGPSQKLAITRKRQSLTVEDVPNIGQPLPLNF